MRLVINSRAGAAAGLKRYNGEGIYSSIGRKVLLSGLKKVVNSLETRNRWEKIADIVVNGHQRKDQSTSSSDQVSGRKRTTVGVKRKSSKKHSSLSPSQPLPKKARKSPHSTSQQSLSEKARKYSKSTINKLINSTITHD